MSALDLDEKTMAKASSIVTGFKGVKGDPNLP